MSVKKADLMQVDLLAEVAALVTACQNKVPVVITAYLLPSIFQKLLPKFYEVVKCKNTEV